MLVKLMEGVEDIPEVVLTEGLPWNWESFPDFLDALAARHYDMDIATQVPHAALRVYRHGRARRRPRAGHRAGSPAMARLAAEGHRAPARWASPPRARIDHKTLDGAHIPTLDAPRRPSWPRSPRGCATPARAGCR